MVGNGGKWWEMVENGGKWWKMVGNRDGHHWSPLVTEAAAMTGTFGVKPTGQAVVTETSVAKTCPVENVGGKCHGPGV